MKLLTQHCIIQKKKADLVKGKRLEPRAMTIFPTSKQKNCWDTDDTHNKTFTSIQRK